MAYGGGEWLVPIQNKVMPGTYIAFSSKARPSNIFGERGYMAVGLNLPYGPEGELITVKPADLQRESLKTFGLQYTDDALLPLRECLMHAKTVYVYRLNGGGDKAAVTVDTLVATAKYSGEKANEFTVIVESNIDEPEMFDVTIKIGTLKAYEKTVATIDELSENPYIDFTGTLVATPGVALAGGTNGIEEVQSHSDFMTKLEKKYINVVAYAGSDGALKKMYKSYVERRVRMEGSYFQLVLHDFVGNSELVIDSYARALDRENEGDTTYWVAGLTAGSEINESAGNKIYDGELKIFTDYKQRELIEFIKTGKFVFHEVNGETRTLSDVNTFTDFSKLKNEDFSKNQIIRVLHQIGNDISVIFNSLYLDKVQNNEIGRTMLWNDIYNHATKLEALGAITDLQPEDIICELGDSKDSVFVEYTVNPVMAMAKLYMHVIVE